MVSCEGLYADIADESLQQTVMKGNIFVIWCASVKHPGFLSFTQDLDEDSRRRRLEELEEIFSSSLEKNDKRLMSLTEEYNQYKRNYLEHIQFDPEDKSLSESNHVYKIQTSFSAFVNEHAPLEAVYIYFDTATFDEIERDVKVKTYIPGHT